jgi:aromatic-L-amino-acid decarboxylase
MTPAEFRTRGREAVDFIADYWERVERLPVLCPLTPGRTMAKMPGSPPERGEDWDAIFADLDRIVIPGLTHWQSPNFFAYFPANGSFPAIIADLISTGLGVQGMLWATSPACTEVEMRVLDWLVEMLDLPASFLSTGLGGGVIHATASEAALTALVAARHRAECVGAEVKAGLGGTGSSLPVVSPPTPDTGRNLPTPSHPTPSAPHFTIYASTQAHSSIIKAAMIAGLATGQADRTHLRLIGTDAAYAMRADLLERAMTEDAAAGRTPLFVCATLGTTSSTAVDPIDRIGAICNKRRAWLHVDAAFAGAALLCPEMRSMSRGLQLADSFCFNPHKWMLTSFDCSCFWTSDRASLIGALSIAPEYLRNAATLSGEVIDYRDWQIPLGRRFRALKLWMVIRHYGVEGLRAHIREHLRLGALFEELVRTDERFEVAAPRTTSLVCFRLRPLPDEPPADTDARNRRLLELLNSSGELYLTHTVLPEMKEDEPRGGGGGGGMGGGGRYVIRMAIGAAQTHERHIHAAWGKIHANAQ